MNFNCSFNYNDKKTSFKLLDVVFIVLINVMMAANVVILTFICLISIILSFIVHEKAYNLEASLLATFFCNTSLKANQCNSNYWWSKVIMSQQQPFCMVGQVTDSMTALTQSFHSLVGVWCLSLVVPIVGQLQVFLSSDYLRVISPFLCFITVLIWFDCFSVMIHFIRKPPCELNN